MAAERQLKPAAHQVHSDHRLGMSPEPIQDRLGPGGGGDDEDDLTPPAGLTIGPVLSSSEDELDHNGEPENFTFEYLPLSQDHDSEDDSENPQTLSDLMLALSVHGPNVIEEGTGGGEGEGRQGVETEDSSQTAELVQESAHARETELRREQAGVWNSCHVQPDSLELDRGKVEEIKSAMASITLPPSAIPAWAHNISDEDWEHQVAKLLSRHSDK